MTAAGSTAKKTTPLLTVGHGTASRPELAALLRDAGVEAVVDVRRFPGSRRHPQFGREQLELWLGEEGISYRWEPRLGGRRRGVDVSPHTGLRNASFRAYADHMDSPEFRGALEELLAESSETSVAVLCSESVWWRCHRRLIADAATQLHRREVRHLMHDGRAVPHAPTGAVRVRDGRLRYDRED